ncbi:GNAT family N-acetyltransferase [Gordonia sp. PP30]|uniref:GNAT family N-acetyltransferase n=1 Tax=unclassified Gordonia (in: high G+C Gram-positive bacteria) TaxID=2657482 RepID=UPI001FFE92E9|nr:MULTISPECIES: GNAT family N-acetyltransferase [unclassified Gordonia (in: high G+C Gram-positive bacteria)]UQE74091.1 GNAT family N-acetyltransferase [Gordonia sp. PP30]
MRLTNVAHLHLPFGRLMGYDVVVSPPGRELPVSFDQGRHVGAGERPGSWMALSFHLPEPVDRQVLAQAWLAVIARHGTLRTAFSPGTDGPVLHEVAIRPGAWVEHPIGPGEAVNEALRDVLDRECSPYAQPAHRLCVLETAAGPTVVIAADHSHVDMWSMLVILRDFLAALAEISAGRTPALAPVPPFAEHTRALRDRPAAPVQVRRRWAEILADSDGVMPRFPLPLGAPEAECERVEVRDVFDVDDSAAFSAQARAEGVSTLALTVATMTAVTHDLAAVPLRAVFPVHSRYDERWHGSVGWFITNSVLESPVAEPAAAANAVREAVNLGSWPLEDVLAPWGGMPEAPGMFAISWLDLRRLPVRVDTAGLQAQYLGASIRTDGVMLWFILDASGLHLRCRYPDTPQARTNVGSWLDLLVARLHDVARSSVRGRIAVDGENFRIERASRADVPDIVGLLADDEIGRTRELGEYGPYEAAFDVLTRDRSHFLAVVRDEKGTAVGTMQLTVLPGLSRGGATRLQIEGLRVASERRGRGLGGAMLDWAHEHGRAHGADLAQVTTDEIRERARAFYARHGYGTEHVGLKRAL